mmetsp:Transcript_15684/g.43255  ORF Transcript_15684/g.43255 Transcript_15684/m.43255 type:complete len:261 (+) Transcript_15684:2681-3463(+)
MIFHFGCQPFGISIRFFNLFYELLLVCQELLVAIVRLETPSFPVLHLPLQFRNFQIENRTVGLVFQELIVICGSLRLHFNDAFCENIELANMKLLTLLHRRHCLGGVMQSRHQIMLSLYGCFKVQLQDSKVICLSGGINVPSTTRAACAVHCWPRGSLRVVDPAKPSIWPRWPGTSGRRGWKSCQWRSYNCRILLRGHVFCRSFSIILFTFLFGTLFSSGWRWWRLLSFLPLLHLDPLLLLLMLPIRRRWWRHVLEWLAS